MSELSNLKSSVSLFENTLKKAREAREFLNLDISEEEATKLIMNKLTPELKEFITTNYGDISAWVNEQIEVAIYNFKNSSK